MSLVSETEKMPTKNNLRFYWVLGSLEPYDFYAFMHVCVIFFSKLESVKTDKIHALNNFVLN